MTITITDKLNDANEDQTRQVWIFYVSLSIGAGLSFCLQEYIQQERKSKRSNWKTIYKEVDSMLLPQRYSRLDRRYNGFNADTVILPDYIIEKAKNTFIEMIRDTKVII